MAENKKSFIAYVDWKDTFDALPDDKAGILIKFIYSYVNDENPKTDDVLINAVFANIKHTLKRDLKKWESQHKQRVKAGKRSAEVRKRNSTLVNARSVSSTDSVSVSVSDSVNVNDINNRKTEFKNSLQTFLEIYEKQMLNDFYEYWTEKKPKGRKMRFEMQKTFDISLRLKRWNKNNFNKNNKNEPRINRQSAETIQQNSQNW